MKKLFEKFYLFSKLTFSFSLLICLVFVLYIFYINYQKENKVFNNELVLSNELKENIEKNSSLINQISNEIKKNQIALKEINENINNISSQNESENFLKIEESINNLNQNFDSLSNEIENIKNINQFKIIEENQPVEIKNSKNEIIDLILIKYENNVSFENEIKYLKKILPAEKANTFEKIYLLETDPYKGHNYLKKKFDEEVSFYLKEKINENPDSLLNKIILPYLKISPTSENLVTDQLIIKIKNIKINIENQNFEDAYENLINVKDYKEIFKLSYSELYKYLEFKEELSKLL